MKNKENTITILIWLGLIGLLFLLCVYLIPALIKGGFWVLLQMMYHPFVSIIVILNLLMWQMVYIRYTERKKTENLDN